MSEVASTGAFRRAEMPLFNDQPPESLVNYSDGALSIINVFHTIQGEGPFAGRRAVFVRLAGCNLWCPSCDTDYTSGRRQVSVEELVREVEQTLAPTAATQTELELLVLTGGEPLRQNITPFCKTYLARGGVHSKRVIQIETNGTVYQECHKDLPWEARTTYGQPALVAVCSPKTSRLNKALGKHIAALKYVVSHDQVCSDDGLPSNALSMGHYPCRPWADFYARNGVVYLQPCDTGVPELNRKNLATAVESCLRYGYVLSIQLHKVAGLE